MYTSHQRRIKRAGRMSERRRKSGSTAPKAASARANSDLAPKADAGHEVPKANAPQSSAAGQDISCDVQETSWEMSVGPLAQARGWLAYKLRDDIHVQFVLDA